MKKIASWMLIFLLSIIVSIMGFSTKTNISPNYLYQVYLDDQVLGVIKSKEQLEKYINDKGNKIKEKYEVENVYAPEGLDVRKIITYDSHVDKVSDVYKKLSSLKPFTISGYQFTIKREYKDDEGKDKTENVIVFVTKEEYFQKALENTIISFVGEETFNDYKNGIRNEIKETGTIYDSIYIENNITRKETKISVNEKIYSDLEELSQFILFSTNENKSTYTVKSGDTIEKVAMVNRISVGEFLISNPEFTSKDNILFEGQVVSVTYANPVVNVVANVTKVEDKTTLFAVEEQSSADIILGDELVVQEGENGIERVTQKIVYKNGFIKGTETLKQVEIKPTTSKVVKIGTKYVSGVGGNYWTWPTTSYSISTSFEWRSGSFHTGLDIYGNAGLPIFAANNGVVTQAGWYGTYGYFISINHNNGYGSAYGHMNAFAPTIKVGSTVERGQLIGFMGNTGYSFGNHVHFEIYYGSGHPGYYTTAKDIYGTGYPFINPLTKF